MIFGYSDIGVCLLAITERKEEFLEKKTFKTLETFRNEM